MEITGERFVPELSGQISLDHYNRYYFVISQVILSDKVVLDIASGEGYGSDLMAAHSLEVIGVDINQEVINYAKSKYTRRNLSFLVGSADNIPVLNNSIDVCVSFETIEHHGKHKEMLYEIKRVLKKDGILIISSPDKLNYTILPKYCNPFHVKELYYEEFRELIKEYFQNTYFFIQTSITSSIIAFDEDYNIYKKPVIINKKGISEHLTPIFNIAIATNDSLFKLNQLIVLYKEEEPFFLIDDFQMRLYNNAQQIVYKSLSYKVGSFFVNPLKKLLKSLKIMRS